MINHFSVMYFDSYMASTGLFRFCLSVICEFFCLLKVSSKIICGLLIDCKFNCHKKCASRAAKDCQGEAKWNRMSKMCLF